MSIQAKPMTHRAALAVKRRLQRAADHSNFELVGERDMFFIRELRVKRNVRSGIEFEEVIMHGRELQRAPSRKPAPRMLKRAS